MTLTLGLQTSFNVTAYSLVKGAMCGNYAPFYSKEEKICLGQIIVKVGAKSLLHPFFICHVYMKYEPNQAKWKVYIL